MPELSPVQVAEPRRGPQKRLMTQQDRASEPPRKLSKKMPKKEEAVLFENIPSLQTPPPQEDSAEFTYVRELWGEMDHDSTNTGQEPPPVSQDMWCSTNNNLGFFLATDVDDYTLGGCVAPAEAEGNLMAILETGGVEQKQEIVHEYINNNGVLSPVDAIGGKTTSLDQEQESLKTETDVLDIIMQEAGITLNPFDDWEDLTEMGQPTTGDFVKLNVDPEDLPDLLASMPSTSRTSTQVYPAMLTTMLTGVDEAESEDPNDKTYDFEADLRASKPSTSRTRVYAKKSLPVIRKPVKSHWRAGKRTKKPGRPQREEEYEITEVPSRREINDQGLTKDEVDGLKYRRQRDLNNLASQKCRAKRGVKSIKKEQELLNETERNVYLKKKAARMQEQITILKDQMTSAQLMQVSIMMGSYM